MTTSKSIKNLKISHLKDCLEKLKYKENQENQERIEHLYKKMFNIAYEMSILEASESLEFFQNKVDDKLRNELKIFNVELTI